MILEGDISRIALDAAFAQDKKGIEKARAAALRVQKNSGLLHIIDLAFQIVKVFEVVVPYVHSSPGVIQSSLKKQFPEIDPEAITAVMYRLAKEKKLHRVRKGSSYSITLEQ